MILPSKHISLDRALLTIGARVLTLLIRPKTVSTLWEELNKHNANQPRKISYDWFLLALALLYAFDSISLENGLVTRRMDRDS